MHPRFYEYYNLELQHLRSTAAEFGREHPKIARRLALDAAGQSVDPYVERLLEGFAFMAARVQLRFDAEFPNFTQHLLEMLYPDFLAPTPSMAIARIVPDYTDPSLVDGVTVPRHSRLRARLGPDAQTACEFRTAHALRLWPIEVAAVRYLDQAPDTPRRVVPGREIVSHLQLTLKLHGDAAFADLLLDDLTFHFGGTELVAYRLAELVFSSCLGALVTHESSAMSEAAFLPQDAIAPAGLSDDEAALPLPARQFRGYRLLREYAAFPARYLFVRIEGLRAALANCKSSEVTLTLLLGRSDARLESMVDASSLQLYAVPIVNLFDMHADRIEVTDKRSSFHLVPDRARPTDFEVFSVARVTGHGVNLDEELRFQPLYAAVESGTQAGDAYFTLKREARMASAKTRQRGAKTSYVGTEVYLAVADRMAPPFAEGLQQMSIEILATNRDLPISMPVNNARGDFFLDAPMAVASVHCERGPTRPVAPHIEGDLVWRAISHLALNYLSLVDSGPKAGAEALRMILQLYGIDDEAPLRRQLDGIRSVSTRQITRRLPLAGPVAFGRGQLVELLLEERAFEGSSPTLFAGVMAEFLRRYASINSFVETVLVTVENREIKRWSAKIGSRPVL